MPYAAVLFDLFDTLVLFDAARLPLVEINGKRCIPRPACSTSGWPRTLARPGVTSRAVTSGVAPAGTDRITRMGFTG